MAARRGKAEPAAPPPAAPAPARRTSTRSSVQQANQRVRDTTMPSITGAAALTVVGQGTPRRQQAAPAAARNAATRQKQEQAWAYFDSVGTVKYAAYFYGKSLSRIRLVPGIVGPDGRPRDALDEEGKPIAEAPQALDVAELLAELKAPIGGQSSILRSFGINLFVAGECNLTGSETDAGETWEVLSTDELHSKGRDSKGNEKYERFDGPGQNGRDLPDGTFVCRIYQPHERFKAQADSSLLGVLDVCEELVLLQREIRAESLSRIPNGILGVADEIQYGPKLIPQDGLANMEGDVPPDDIDEDPFTADLLEAMMTAIRDKSSAASMMPIVVRGPADAIDKGLKHLLLVRPESARTILKRKEAIEMFAIGIDLPVEVIQGHGNTTFANAFQIDEDTYKVHILPLMQLVADGITHGYLWPKMAKAAGLSPTDPLPPEITQYVVWWDPTNLLTNPDRSQQATEGHKLFTLSNAAWRRACGFNESDAPDEAEIEERISIMQRVRELPPGDGGQFPQDGRAPQNVSEALAASAAAPEPDPLALLAARIAGAADVSVERAVDRFGSRLRNAARKNGHANLVEGVTNTDIALTLGPSISSALIGPEEMFPGDFAALARKAHEWAQEAGVPDPADFAVTVATVAEQVAERRLYGETGFTGDRFLNLVTAARNGSA